jgi:hypothetical protein
LAARSLSVFLRVLFANLASWRFNSSLQSTSRFGSDPGGLAGLAEPLELLAASALAGLFVIGLAPHLFPEAAALAELAEASDGFLDGLAGTDP